MKAKKFKLLTIVAAASMGMSIFAGCGAEKPVEGGDAEIDKNQVLKVAVFEGGHGSVYWDKVAEKFEAENPGVDVQVEANPKIGDIVRPQIAAGNPPDFIYLGSTDQSGLATALIKEQGLTDLTDVFDGEVEGGGKLKDQILDGFLDTALTAPYGDGKVYLAPLYYNVTGMWYNKTYFEEKGYKEPKTWNDFFALGDKAKADGKALFTYQGQAPSYNEAMLWPMIASAGGDEALEDVFNYKEGSWNSDGAKIALEAYEKIANEGHLLKGTVAMNHTQSQLEFLQGNALFIPNGNWFEDEMKDAIPEDGFSFGFMAPPVVKDGDTQYATTMIEQMYIPKDAKNVELAKEFLAFQYEEENVKLNSELAGTVVPTKNGLELAKEYLNQSNYECFKIFENGVKPITLNFATVGQTEVNLQEEIYGPLASLMNKEITSQDWADRMEKANEKLREVLVK